VGFEQAANSSGNNGLLENRDVKSDAFSSDFDAIGPDVASIIKALAALSPDARQAIANALTADGVTP